MSSSIFKSKPTILFLVLAGFFVTNALVAQFIGVKIFSLEDTFGFDTFNWSIFGATGSLQFTAGVLLWPVVFVMTDIINEYFGRRGVLFLSFLAVFLIAYAFVMVFAAVGLAPADWWQSLNVEQGIPNMQDAFRVIFGQGMLIITGSIIAFIVGQILDAWVFHKIRSLTGSRFAWLRATASTMFSQLIDSVLVLYIAFVLGPQLTGSSEPWTLNQFFAIAFVNSTYKLIAAIILIPAIYGAHGLIDLYLGKERAQMLKAEAMKL